jgi:phage terminase large subunit GpA-like protein
MTHALAGAFAPLRPPPLLTVSQWADAHRMLGTESSAEPGRWRTDRTPYLREPMDRLSPTDPCERVVLQWGSQLGKTEAGLNWMGYVIHHQPAPLLMVQPSLEMAELYSEQRFAPLLRSTPELAALTGDPKSRDSGNKKLVKQFPGGFLRMVGANSPASLAGMPARYVFGDEIDRWPASAGREGSPLGLIERRTGSFARRKFLLTSTPTVRGASLVESLMALTGYRRYYVPCPHCSHMQTLRRSQLVWPEGRPREAEYACEDCGACIRDTERTKTTMLLGGEWRPDHPEREDGREYGYHLNTLYAPGGWSSVSWGALAEQWERSKSNAEAVKVYVNTIDGETYDETEDATTDPETLQGRAEVYARPVPEGVRVLTAGVDVQQDRVEVEVVGWGDGEESWSIDFAALPGDPTGPQLWADLDDYLRRRWDGYGIAAVCVDSGYMAQQVQDWCYHRRGRRVYAIKGIAGAGRPLWPKRGSVAKRGTGWKVWMVGVDTAKDVLWPRWSLAEPGPGYMHTPTSRDEQWYAQVLAERPTVTRGGRREWVRSRGVRSEALDCRVYAYAALCSLRSGGVRLEDIAPPVDRPAATTAARGVAAAAAPPAPPALTAPAKRHKPARSSWLDPGARLR